MPTTLKLKGLEELLDDVEINRFGLEGIASEPNGVQIVSDSRTRLWEIIQNIDTVTSNHLKDDQPMLVMWGVRMKTMLRRFHTLDKNLIFANKPQWDWQEVIGALAVIYTIIKASEAALQEANVEY